MLGPQQTCFAFFSLLALACRAPQEKSGGGAVASNATSAQLEQSTVKTPTTQLEPTAVPAPVAPEPFVDEANNDSTTFTELSRRWGPGELIDLGPAGSVAATPHGALFITRDDHVVMAKRSGKSGFEPVSLSADSLSKYGYGPSVSATHVYWSSHGGRLMRASLRTLQTEVLFDHARPGTRTAVQTVMKRDVVAFVATIDDRSFAYIWASPDQAEAELIDASADGHEATSVALVKGTPHPRLIVLEGRTSMSPVHSRVVRVTPRRALLEMNEIIWIGPGSHDLTEIHAIDARGGAAVAFLPTQKDFNAFGIAELKIGSNGGESPEPSWRVYPNGLDPAPLTAAHVCQGDYVVFARPSEKRPRSPQQLHIKRLDSAVLDEGDVLVRSHAFNDVSIAPVDGGALLVWTADKRTWGLVLSCPTP